jgi:hypothetical protein
MAEAIETPVWREDEQSKVESWRLHVLIEAGFSPPLAERLAVSDATSTRASSSSARAATP